MTLELVRNTDPVTSRSAVPSESARSTQCYDILAAWDRPQTSLEGWRRAGVDKGWRRVSDLKNSGYLRWTGEVRRSRGSSSGREHQVLRRTPKGEQVLRGEITLILKPEKKIPYAELLGDDRGVVVAGG